MDTQHPRPGCQRFRENGRHFCHYLVSWAFEDPAVPGAALRTSVRPSNPNSATEQGPLSRDCFVSALSLRETRVGGAVGLQVWGSPASWFNLTSVRDSLSSAAEAEASKVCPVAGIHGRCFSDWEYSVSTTVGDLVSFPTNPRHVPVVWCHLREASPTIFLPSLGC